MLENPRSPRVRAVAKLAKKPGRADSGLFLLEGPQAVAEALTFKPELVVDLFATPTALERYANIAQAAEDADIEVEYVTEQVLEAMSDTVTPQGFVAVCRQFPTSVKDIFASEPRLIAILEEVRDPGNAGTIVRAADAAGADAVIFTGRSVDLYNPKVVRSSTGSIFHLPIAVDVELEDVLTRARAAGLQILAADIKGDDLLSARNDGLLAASDGLAVRQRGAGPARRQAVTRRSRCLGTHLRQRGVDEPRDRCIRLPLRVGLRAQVVASDRGTAAYGDREPFAAGSVAPVNLCLVSEPTEITEASVDAAVEAAIAAIAAASDSAALKTVRAEHTGESSPLARLNGLLRSVPNDQKAALGKLVGQARGRVNQAFAARESAIVEAEASARLDAERVDVTAAAVRQASGARHPLSLLQDQVIDVFVGMGWEIAEGPELESEWFNFDALNFDADHPARAMQDTFFIDPPEAHLVLRTHTSPVQVRTMLEREVPIYVLAPGRVFRTDELDATHTPVFTQFEGLAVDKGLTMAHLRGTLEHFARTLFGDGAKIRLRPNYFPFTEPSAELDVWHPTFVGGARWIEWGGCGMINPNVLKAAGIDPEVYSGFAFGMGIERALMFRNDVEDMRDIVEGDVRFSQQFGMVV